METIKDRLNLFVEKTGITGRSFSASIGKSVSYLGMMKENISTDILVKIHEVYPQLSILWILFGEGDMFVKDNQQTHNEEKIHSKVEQTIESSKNSNVSNTFVDEKNFLRNEFMRMERQCEQLIDNNTRLAERIVELTGYIISTNKSHRM